MLAEKVAVSEIGDFIRERRESLGFSLEQVSLKTLDSTTGKRVAAGSISLIEQGKRKPRPDTLARLAPALRVPYTTLMSIASYLPADAVDLFDPRRNLHLRNLVDEADNLTDEELESMLQAIIKSLRKPGRKS